MIHGYEFDKGPEKWFLLERNRWRTLLVTYPPALLWLLAPALAAGELAPFVAARDGWLSAKLRAQLATIAGLPRRSSAAVASPHRRIAAAAFAAQLTAELDNPYLALPPPLATCPAFTGGWHGACCVKTAQLGSRTGGPRVSMILSWVLFPLVLAAVGLGWGALVEWAAGERSVGVLAIPLGLAGALVVAGIFTMFSFSAPAAAPVVAAGALVGLGEPGGERRRPGGDVAALGVLSSSGRR